MSAPIEPLVQPIRVMIADDEPLARDSIRLRLDSEPDFTVVGEFASAKAVLPAIERDPPDVLFLDIRMPEMDGLELTGRLGVTVVPIVVFVTGYGEYALKAFRAQALDYLVKPYDDERFAEVVSHIRRRVSEIRDGTFGREIRHRIAAGRSVPDTGRLAVNVDGRIAFFRTSTVDWVEAAGDYVRLHIGGKRHLLRSSLIAMIELLGEKGFVRIHRSTVVNVDRVVALEPYFRGDYIVMLQDGTRLKLSRTYRDDVAARLGTSL